MPRIIIRTSDSECQVISDSCVEILIINSGDDRCRKSIVPTISISKINNEYDRTYLDT